MKIQIKGVVYDTSDIFDAPINLMFELNRLTGMEGPDVQAGLTQYYEDLTQGRTASHKALMGMAALVWLGKRIAGEEVGFEEAVSGLSIVDIEPVAEPAAGDAGEPTSLETEAPGPTQPGSAPAIEAPAPAQSAILQDQPFRSPGPTSEPPSESTDSQSSTSGPA